jgi:hypothetical protein
MTSGDIRLLTQRKITAMLATIACQSRASSRCTCRSTFCCHSLKARWQNWAGCDTQRMARPDARYSVNTAAVVHVHRGADDDDWDYENESAPEPDFNGGGGAPLEQRPRCPG